MGVKNIAMSLTSLAESDKTKKKKKKPMDISEKDVDVEQDYIEEAATKISKKKQHPKYIAPQSINRYAYLAHKRVIAPNVSRVLTSSKSHMQKGQVIDTMRAINSSVPESDEGHMRGRSIVAKRKLFVVEDDDENGERDMRFYVMGKHRNGDAVMYGLGVRASDV
ncbi:hypothetical protein M8C21_025281 [Ambrosia artemisiifolia]|uniref:Uncharacterized protein n=1 Tax=Ambrosia artemisiifolia TaxID=4212 RepID=A0AAD5BPI0_AMBAR|nr:hypothetical protein M8C21_025281 [Ambrosia artemisiifolia]